MAEAKYKRILLKLSGEALMGTSGYGIDPNVMDFLCDEIKSIKDIGVDVALVVGGGNIFRGMNAESQGIDRSTGDYMGMLGTVINALAFQNALEKKGMMTRLQSAIRMEQIAEPFIRRRAVRHLEKGRIVLFGAGTGNPYFTTDSAAALRAFEVGADILVMGKNGVDGVYDSDPKKNPDAKRFLSVSFDEVHKRKLRVMDMTAITLCQENKLPIAVLTLDKAGVLKKFICGENIGTKVGIVETEFA